MKPLRLTGLLALLLGSASAIQAQRINPDPLYSIHTQEARRTVVKFAPLTLFDPDNTIQFGIERLMGQQHAVQLELGYGFQGMNLWETSQNQRYSDREVWRGRAEWRYYLRKTAQPQGQYVALEGFYKQVNVRERGTIGVGCSTGSCQYYQLFTAPLQKYVWGGHVKFGRQFPLIAHNDRLLVDLYLGLGFRRRMTERYQSSGNSYYGSAGYTLFDTFSPTPHALISIAYGVKFGWAF